MKITPKQYAILLYEMTKDATKAQLKETTRAFLQMLVKGRALSILPRIMQFYGNYYNRREWVVDVEVTTARTIPKIEKLVAQTFRSEDIRAKALSYNFVVNPEVLGGARIRVGDWMLDDTLRARLLQLKQKMTT